MRCCHYQWCESWVLISILQDKFITSLKIYAILWQPLLHSTHTNRSWLDTTLIPVLACSKLLLQIISPQTSTLQCTCIHPFPDGDGTVLHVHQNISWPPSSLSPAFLLPGCAVTFSRLPVQLLCTHSNNLNTVSLYIYIHIHIHSLSCLTKLISFNLPKEISMFSSREMVQWGLD